jgi:hypothetical protein
LCHTSRYRLTRKDYRSTRRRRIGGNAAVFQDRSGGGASFSFAGSLARHRTLRWSRPNGPLLRPCVRAGTAVRPTAVPDANVGVGGSNLCRPMCARYEEPTKKCTSASITGSAVRWDVHRRRSYRPADGPESSLRLRSTSPDSEAFSGRRSERPPVAESRPCCRGSSAKRPPSSNVARRRRGVHSTVPG